METRAEKAVAQFNSGFNCSQAVFSVFCESYGLDVKTALKLSCGLGGGVRSGEVCGAVSGAVLVIGLKYGQDNAADTASKSTCYAKTVEFITAFKSKNRSVVCREILGCDISTESGYAQAQKSNLFKVNCIDAVKSAVETLEELGY